jgi:NitT/TauT family transport system permease protein
MTRKRIERWVPPGLVTFAVGIVVWKAVSLFFLPVVFPAPEVLLERMIAIYGDPASYMVVGKTLRRIFEGFALSMLLGTALGVLMGLKRNVEIFFDSWVMVLLTFPAVCWAFLW